MFDLYPRRLGGWFHYINVILLTGKRRILVLSALAWARLLEWGFLDIHVLDDKSSRSPPSESSLRPSGAQTTALLLPLSEHSGKVDEQLGL